MNFLITSIKNCRVCIRTIMKGLANNFRRNGTELCYAFNMNAREINPISSYEKSLNSLKEIISDGFLWAVPKHRRSLERRMTRRMGFGKMLIPKKNLIVCDTCGHFHPVHTVCGNCYEKVKQETQLMQDAILKELKLDPIEKEVVVLYENDPKGDKIFEGKRIVELPKERPQWFSKNLLIKDSEHPHQKPKSIGTAKIPPTVTSADK